MLEKLNNDADDDEQYEGAALIVNTMRPKTQGATVKQKDEGDLLNLPDQDVPARKKLESQLQSALQMSRNRDFPKDVRERFAEKAAWYKDQLNKLK